MARQAISFSCILLILSMLVVFAIGHPVESMGLAKRTEPTLHNTLSKRKVRLDSAEKACPNPTPLFIGFGSGRVKSQDLLPEPEPVLGHFGFGSGRVGLYGPGNFWAFQGLRNLFCSRDNDPMIKFPARTRPN
ncbi:hypothetical protein PCANC_09056 [Puccinia coronata f. sp. avenae]|uniref:Uncharacterized protein n=1 Tax=Puccinia coronata f. sp. avenae TaxID=200324 RepID=A0A2N5T222_9BASI|nr:hypothetical protein PCANC_09056 [Puccinia coronata f. sp. avenae]